MEGGGYSGLRDVTATAPFKNGKMESFFTAETLKYLFLLQDPDHRISLETYVFNTEAHPLRVFGSPGEEEPYEPRGHKHPLQF